MNLPSTTVDVNNSPEHSIITLAHGGGNIMLWAAFPLVILERKEG